jgi:hypothetical protein
MGMIVKPKDDQAVLFYVALLRLIRRISLEVRRLILMIVESRLMRDYEVSAGRDGPAKNVEGGHPTRRDGFDRGLRRARLEGVHGLAAPGDAEFLQLFLDARDDVLRGHTLTLQ